MPRCWYCDGEIEIRFVNGQRTPIHIGSTRCDAYSSAYSEESVSRFEQIARDHARAVSTRYEDYCRETSCPHCRAAVYFIRHNGGSVWVDPPLGWPWPKHKCFTNGKEPSWLTYFYKHSNGAGNTSNRLVGLVVGAKWTDKGVLLAIDGGGAGRACIGIQTSATARFHLGSVGIIDKNNKKFISSRHDIFDVKRFDVSPLELDLKKEWQKGT